MAQPLITPEHWTELIAARRQRRLCSEHVEALKRSCASECGKRHVSECAKCWSLVLERMRQRYSEGQDREWFTYRKAFHQELEGLFADAKEHRTSVRQIEARIESEKEAWYRWNLRKYPEYLVTCDDQYVHEELKAMLDDPDRSRDEVVAMVWRGIGKPPDWAEHVDAFAVEVAAAGGNPAALQRLYVKEFFLNHETGEPLDHSKPYLDDYTSNENMSIEEAFGKLSKDAQEIKIIIPQREFFVSRLNDLRRAKMADELEKTQQATSEAQAAEERISGDELYNLPPCSVCGKVVDTNDVFSCTVCQATVQIGGNQGLTVYCSEECYDAGHAKHVEEMHRCHAGDNCVQNRETGPEEDVVMEDDAALDAFACKDCVGLKRLTLFCSERCASENIARHQHEEHETKIEADAASSWVSSLSHEIESILQRENPGIKMVLM
ncbi:hypothetical protein H0G86_000505 [Trichoderma simmonsii]|uniref:Suppressor of anucleate metulae protein B n=1 Tax=Trichoderma simmonsii TaxID=1491479 RepID=A0A8G0KZP8_9HYPO|nr:hypothetical protein H0G86_000505 [Trichoderma simmonsii]